MKRLYMALAAIVVALLILALAGSVYLQRYLDAPLALPEAGMRFDIPVGTPFRAVGERLEELGLVDSSLPLRLYARATGKAMDVQAGEYDIDAGMSLRELLAKFTSGAVTLYSFTIVEGWNHRDLLAALAEHPHVETTMTNEDWPALLVELDAETAWPEGLFLPETYRFARGTTDRQLLRQAYALMQRTVGELWPERAPDAPVSTPYEALILASIVEKETALAEERPAIAGVFARRLEKGMRLQTDPTVIYGIGADFDGNLTRRDLRTDTPYNTYTRNGLPPTPIAMPGRDAILAALQPADGDAMYFVATGLGDGSHKFSRTKEEHDAAVAEYLERLRRNRR